ncbi:GNAT family N-acetyltransferase [Flavobacterium supellecticarium]|nr:GNAT family N-acetyltransferase [Flavobacterium supellecticarium]
MKYKVDVPENFEDEQLNLYLNLLIKQGQVANPNIEKIKSCSFLGMVYDNDRPIGIGAIKQVYKTPFAKAEIPELADEYDFELGYIYIVNEERYRGKGIAKDLCNRLLEKISGKNIFATTEENDENSMKFLLQKLGFAKKGKAYTGAKTGKLIGLYLRTAKI